MIRDSCTGLEKLGEQSLILPHTSRLGILLQVDQALQTSKHLLELVLAVLQIQMLSDLGILSCEFGYLFALDVSPAPSRWFISHVKVV